MPTRIEIRTPSPHSGIQAQIMQCLDNPHLIEMWIACGTKFGKTLGLSSALCNRAPVTPNALFRWIAPIYPQTKIGMRLCERMLPRAIRKVNKSDMMIDLFLTKTLIQFFHGQHPESLEGEATAGNILDECAKMKEEVYASAKTTTTVTRGPIIGISTPMGKNWFYHKCMEAKEEMDRAKAENRPPTKVFITAPTSANPHVSEEAIEDAKRSLPWRLFKQYYLAEFVDDSDVFTGFRDVLAGKKIDKSSHRQFYVDPSIARIQDGTRKPYDIPVVIGADWGKIQDWTVFTAWDYKERKQVGFLRFTGQDYIMAAKELMWFASKFRKCDMVFHDSTGLGEPMNDIMEKTGLPFEGIPFSSKSKSKMVNSLILAIQKKECKLLNWAAMIREMDAFTVQTTEVGGMKYGAPAGMTDDIVCSMILGWAAVSEFTEHPLDIRIVEELGQEQKIGSAPEWLRAYEEDAEDEEGSWEEIIMGKY